MAEIPEKEPETEKLSGDPITGVYTGRIHQTESNDDAHLNSASVVGGTAWLFSRINFDRSFDYLFVDEVGQVSVANIVAMATCAKIHALRSNGLSCALGSFASS